MSKVKKYRTLPNVIEAIQFDGTNSEDIRNFIKNSISSTEEEINSVLDVLEYSNFTNDNLTIYTSEGSIEVYVGDFIIKGIQGEFYPCNPEIFKNTYEAIYGG